jgi:hypothetical protein
VTDKSVTSFYEVNEMTLHTVHAIPQEVYQIHIVDCCGKENDGIKKLTSTYITCRTRAELRSKWNTLMKEDHYAMDMIEQVIYTASAFHD